MPRVTRVDHLTPASSRVKGVPSGAWKKLSTLRASSGVTEEIVAFVAVRVVEKSLQRRAPAKLEKYLRALHTHSHLQITTLFDFQNPCPRSARRPCDDPTK